MAEYNYDAATTRSNRYPRIKKLGVCSPNGEMTPFVWKGQLMRLELDDPLNGTDDSILRQAIIRNCETGEVLSRFGDLFDIIYEDGKILWAETAHSILPSSTMKEMTGI